MNKQWLWLLLISPFMTLADGLVIDKVYQPYVLPFEREFEWRLISSQTEQNNRLGQRIGYGHAISEYLMLEGYVIAERDLESNNFEVQAYELEARWMLSEQGELWADWGVLFELENQNHKNRWEASSGVLVEKEFNRTSLTLNAFLIYEWGTGIEEEFELEFRAKYRYRYMPEFQPAIEIYSGEKFFGVGPAFMGVYRIERQRQIKWEMAFITELSQSGKDHTFRLGIEYEF
jgi:hypothetical protein